MTAPRIRAHLLPPDRVSDACVVAVDVLRATSTLAVALDHGAGPIRAATTLEEAFALKRRDPAALLCGERDGRKIEGFDLGNSPLQITAERVTGRRMIFASTNGSRAMAVAARARRRRLLAFVNLAAVVEAVARESEVIVICAGKQGVPCLEDAACAGMLVDRLAARGGRVEGAAARLMRALAPRDGEEVRVLVEGCGHGRALRALGAEFARDVEFCARLDVLDCAAAW